RHKDGISDQRMISRVTHDELQFAKAFNDLWDMAEPNERIYASADERDVRKAARVFKERIVAHEHGEDAEFWRHVNTRWVSALMQTRCRDGKLWLFDCDTMDEYNELMKLLPDGTGAYQYQTKNGHHVVCAPFDLRYLPPHLQRLRTD